MRFSCLLLFSLFLLLPACSSVVIKPDPAIQGSVDGELITLENNQVTVKLKLQDVVVRPSPVEQNYCAFYVEVLNNSSAVLPVELSDFHFVGADGSMLQASNPEFVVEQLTETIPYLMPAPYVGYYYLQDRVSASHSDQFRSEGYYFSSRRPENLLQNALGLGDIAPNSRAQGAIYFPVELRRQKSFKIQYRISGDTLKTDYFDFSFLVEEK